MLKSYEPNFFTCDKNFSPSTNLPFSHKNFIKKKKKSSFQLRKQVRSGTQRRIRRTPYYTAATISVSQTHAFTHSTTTLPPPPPPPRRRRHFLPHLYFHATFSVFLIIPTFSSFIYPPSN